MSAIFLEHFLEVSYMEKIIKFILGLLFIVSYLWIFISAIILALENGGWALLIIPIGLFLSLLAIFKILLPSLKGS